LRSGATLVPGAGGDVGLCHCNDAAFANRREKWRAIAAASAQQLVLLLLRAHSMRARLLVDWEVLGCSGLIQSDKNGRANGNG
jgi:predicted cobalt transporter CbtA